MTVKVLDVTGLSCPLPILRTKKAIKTMAPGEMLQVLASDPGAVQDFPAFCRQSGNELVETGEEGGAFKFLIRRGA